MSPSVLDQLACDRIRLAVLRRTQPDAVVHDRAPDGLWTNLPHQVLGHVPGRGDQHQRLDARRLRRLLDHQAPQRQQRQIAAHARPDNDQRPVRHTLEHPLRLREPPPDRAVLERAARLPMAGIIEADQTLAASGCPVGERLRLGRDHLRLEAAQPEQVTMPIGADARLCQRGDQTGDAANRCRPLCPIVRRCDIQKMCLARRHMIHALQRNQW